MHFEDIVSAGVLPTMTVIAPGTQGAGITGEHGPGVSTPSAAAVCAAVTGLARLVHRPNGMMLANGLLSRIVATGRPSTNTPFSGSTFSTLGAKPKLHKVWAAATTGRPTVEA